LSQTGYQQDPKRLGGPVEDDNSIAFKLTTRNEDANIHLRGSVQDFYDGHMWSKSDKSTKKYNGVMEADSPAINSELKTVIIAPEKTITSSAFNPLYANMVNNSWNYYFAGSDFELYNPKAVRRGKSYSIDYYDYDFNELQKFIISRGNAAGYSEGLKKYLQVPQIVPQSIRDLTLSITGKYQTAYQKASAIENYLKQKFSYSKETSVVPEDREFVDYFINEEKKGYCTYFATAMAVMCRIADIPTRYIEGYAIQGSLDPNEEVNILNSEAHSWVEVYFNNVGWVGFDPTPGMNSIALGTSLQENPGTEKPEEESGQIPGRETPEKTRPDTPEKPEKPETPNKVQTGERFNAWYVLLPIIFLLTLSSLILAASLFSFRRRRYLEYSLQILIIYGKAVNVKYSEGETIREYLLRIDRNLGMGLKDYPHKFQCIQHYKVYCYQHHFQ
jgi:transglutaminase-like putative cysteine protease